MLSEADLPAVIEAARLGAEWAWSAIYRDTSPAVLRYLRGHGAHEPEDLLGEVFVQVVRKLSDFDGDGRDFRAWVFTIARNQIVDEWRRDGRRPVDPVADEALHASAHAHAHVGDAEHDAMRRLGDVEVREVLEKLTRDQRDVLFLRLFAGFTVEEVARVTGKKPGAVKALQARGIAAIRKKISERP